MNFDLSFSFIHHPTFSGFYWFFSFASHNLPSNIIFALYFTLKISWHTDDWQACTKTCGKGTQSRSVVCRAKLNDTHYDIDQSEFLCNTTLKPMTFRSSCNDVNCPATWKTYWPEVWNTKYDAEFNSFTRAAII